MTEPLEVLRKYIVDVLILALDVVIGISKSCHAYPL
jgi:hypothetical protein